MAIPLCDYSIPRYLFLFTTFTTLHFIAKLFGEKTSNQKKFPLFKSQLNNYLYNKHKDYRN